MENSCLLRSPLQNCVFPTFSSSSSVCSSHSIFLLSSSRNVDRSRKKIRNPKIACVSQESSQDKDTVSCMRRAILFVGVSVLPLAIEALVDEDSGIMTQEQKQQAEQTLKGDSSSSNSLLSILSGLGILSSGIPVALYNLARKEKVAIKMTAVLDELFAALKSTKSTITSPGQELQKEKTLVKELKTQIDTLQTNLSWSEGIRKALEGMLEEKLNTIEVLQERFNLLSVEMEDKEKHLKRLKYAVAKKEYDYKKLSSKYEHTQDELSRLDSDIKRLKDELLKIEKELESKNCTISDLNTQISWLLIERDESKTKLDATQKEYSDLKLMSEKKASSDAKLLEEREHQLQKLEEKLKFNLVEADGYKSLVADLTEERDNVRKMIDLELKNAKKLQQELQVTLETLEESRNEAYNLAKQLKQSRNFCSELEAEVSKDRIEFAEARKSLERDLDESRQTAEVLSVELTSVKDVIKKTKEQLQTVSHERAVAAEKCDSLQKELVDIYKKAESAVEDLKVEKKLVTSMKKELKALENQLLKDKEAWISLEADEEEATRSLDGMSRNAVILSNDLEVANSRISSLEDEKAVLSKSPAEQKQVSHEAREKMEDAHNLVMRLGKESRAWRREQRNWKMN